MGNSVVGKAVSDYPNQRFELPTPVIVERYDRLVSNRDVALLKMDTQGFECNVVRGMGDEFERIGILKTEVAAKWLAAQDGCSDQILFDLFHERQRIVTTNDGVHISMPGPAGVYDVVVRPRDSTKFAV